MKLLILSDLHAEFETFEVAKDMDYDLAVLAGDIMAPGRAAASWLRDPARFDDKPILQIAGNHEYYGSVLDQEQIEMRRQANEHGIHFLDCDEAMIAGVRFLGCTLWTDFRLRVDNPGFAGQPVRLLSDRHRSMTACSRFLADYSAIRIDDPLHSNSLGFAASGADGHLADPSAAPLLATQEARRAVRRAHGGRHPPCTTSQVIGPTVRR